MGLSSFNRQRREQLGKVKVEHDEGDKITSTGSLIGDVTDVTEKNIQIQKDAEESEKRKEEVGGTIRAGDTPEETQAKNALVARDAKVTVKELVKAETTTIDASGTTEENDEKNRVVMEDAEVAEQHKEEAEGATVHDPDVARDEVPVLETAPDPTPVKTETVTDETLGGLTKRGRKKSDS